ncbi:MAG: hypothetical protein AB7E30_09880 [Lawsonibacter sp.]
MTDRSRVSPPLVGGSSLLVVFAVLCLTAFALLSLSAVQAGGRLGDTAAQAVSGYYQADAQAEAILSQLRQGRLPDGVTVEDALYSYSCSISETQNLNVAVSLNGADYTILRWQVVSTTDWQPDDSVLVWDGQVPD